MAAPVFRNPDTQRQFDADGFVRIPGFLSSQEVEDLKAAFFELLPESGGALTSDESDFKSKSEITYDFTFIDRNWEYKQRVFDVITAAFEQHYEPILADYTPIIANFIRKEHDGGEVPLHQNWAFVDEVTHTSVSIWVPLVDSSRANGTLEIAPGSHKRFGQYRGPLVPWECEHIKEDIIRDYLVPMYAKAGDAVILDDSVIHYSNINRTEGLRLTIQLILIPKGQPSIHYHLDRSESPDVVRILEVDREFYMKFHPWKKPEGKLVGHKKVNLRFIDRAEWDARLAGPEFGDPRYVPYKPQQVEPVAVSEVASGPTVEQVVDAAPVGILGRIKRIFS